MRWLAVLLLVACGAAPPPAPPVVMLPPDNHLPSPKTEAPDVLQQDPVVFLERYRQAILNKDVETLVTMASPRYHDDAGTPDDPSDDTDRAGLEKYLRDGFARVQDLRFDAEFGRARIRADGAIVVEATIDATFTIAGSPHHKKDTTEFVLEHSGDSYLFLSGM